MLLTRLIFALAAAVVPLPPGYHVATHSTLAPGVSYHRLVSGEPQVAQVVTISPSAPVQPFVSLSNNQVAETKVNDRLEPTSSACRRHDCVVGTNGDFFCTEDYCPTDQYQPEGGVIAGGRMLRSPYSTGWQEQQLMFDRNGCPLPPQRLNWQGTVVSYDLHTSLQLGGVNVDRSQNQTVLYTPAYGPRTLTNQFGDELVLRLNNPNWLGLLGQAVTATPIRWRHDHGNTQLTSNTVVLSAHGQGASRLLHFWLHNHGHSVTLRLDTTPPVWNSIGAKPLILQNGHYTGQWYQPAVPMTIFAWKPDCTRFVITADGRQPGSVGLNTRQAADLAASLGATTAFGLDGGGSTTLVANGGKILNTPSGSIVRQGSRLVQVEFPSPGQHVIRHVERPVADSLLFVPKPGYHPNYNGGTATAISTQGDQVITLPSPGNLPQNVVSQLEAELATPSKGKPTAVALLFLTLVTAGVASQWRRQRA